MQEKLIHYSNLHAISNMNFLKKYMVLQSFNFHPTSSSRMVENWFRIESPVSFL